MRRNSRCPPRKNLPAAASLRPFESGQALSKKTCAVRVLVVDDEPARAVPFDGLDAPERGRQVVLILSWYAHLALVLVEVVLNSLANSEWHIVFPSFVYWSGLGVSGGQNTRHVHRIVRVVPA